MSDLPNLTELEREAFDADTNVADGHARHPLTPSQQRIIDRLPELFGQAARTSEADLDHAAQVAFLSALGQHSAPVRAEMLTCYSSSVATEILGRALYAAGTRRVALIHPTFDNIHAILTGVGLVASPVPETALLDGRDVLPPDTDVLFCTTPNNPTGQVLPQEQLAYWATRCAQRGIVLVLDTSFRGFDVRAQYDHYAVLAAAGCRYVVVEDTGKLWPTLDLKVGILAYPPGDPLPLRRVYTDVLLGVSPLILLLVRRFAEDAASGGFGELHRLVAGNRRLLDDVLGRPLADPDSRISVARLRLPGGVSGAELCRALAVRGVHVLPCAQFHWADHTAGDQFIRVALGRSPEVVARAATTLRDFTG